MSRLVNAQRGRIRSAAENLLVREYVRRRHIKRRLDMQRETYLGGQEYQRVHSIKNTLRYISLDRGGTNGRLTKINWLLVVEACGTFLSKKLH
jgi:hypothetical protein